jgi:hypothetical protein
LIPRAPSRHGTARRFHLRHGNVLSGNRRNLIVPLSIPPYRHALVAAALLGVVMLAAPTRAQTDQQSQAPAATENAADQVDQHIADLHAKLGITAAEEKRWGRVAAVMRRNAQRMGALAAQRSANLAHMSALDDLNSYVAIAKEHEQGLQKLIVAFASLYRTMPADQRKQADAVFAAAQSTGAPAQ